MNTRLKRIVSAITPPIFLTMAKFLFGRKTVSVRSKGESGEKNSEWYDFAFEKDDKWIEHYTQSGYYFLWTVIVDRMLRSKVTSVLEVGCGTGQLASLLRDCGISEFHGFDFSPKRLAQAKSVCPEFTFSVEDAFKTKLFEEFSYQAVLCTEFLEHVDGDLEVLKRIKSGTLFYGTVPNFPFESHVRHFRDSVDVSARYDQCFTQLKVDTILANESGKMFFLLEGIIA